MYRPTVLKALTVIAFATNACTLVCGTAAARDIHVAVHVSTLGLDLSRSSDVRTLYTRLQHAAHVVCTHGDKVGLEPLPDPAGCYEKALGNAVRSAKLPQLTQIYLASHTLQEAAVLGIEVPEQVAAK
jgi:UrcA family protein